MSQTCQFTIRIDESLKIEAQKQARERFGVGLGTLAKLFFKSLTGESSVNFYVNDETFEEKFDTMLKSKKIKSALKNYQRKGGI